MPIYSAPVIYTVQGSGGEPEGEGRGAGKGGRLVIRPSGTEPVIRVMAEGDDHRLVNGVVDDICEAIRIGVAVAAAE